jgi:tRNA-Thr(GGU) m(6)t(6)A37 methyltransferase TsaA
MNPLPDLSQYHICYRAIGIVQNAFNQSTPPETLKSVESLLIIDPTLQDGLTGLQVGQRILVIFHFHLAPHVIDLLQHPRADRSRPKRGVFALRSPHRPNPIGATIVDLIAIQGNVLTVTGLDALNNTPVLDIKPFNE